MFSMAMTLAISPAKTMSHRGATSAPIFALSAVNITSRNTANESCKLRTTCFKIKSFAVPASPSQIVTIDAGTMAIARVMSRLGHGGSFMSRKPSVTI